MTSTDTHTEAVQVEQLALFDLDAEGKIVPTDSTEEDLVTTASEVPR